MCRSIRAPSAGIASTSADGEHQLRHRRRSVFAAPAQRALLFLSRIWAWLFLGLLILFFVVAVPLSTGGSVSFFTARNSQNILVAITPVLLLGLGQTFVIIGAGIDL